MPCTFQKWYKNKYCKFSRANISSLVVRLLVRVVWFQVRVYGTIYLFIYLFTTRLSGQRDLEFARPYHEAFQNTSVFVFNLKTGRRETNLFSFFPYFNFKENFQLKKVEEKKLFLRKNRFYWWGWDEKQFYNWNI